MNRCSRGFTLVEILVGLALATILSLAVYDYLRSTISSHRRATEMVERVQLESTARNVVIGELSMAGNGIGLIGELTGPTIEIALADADGSDSFTVHYLAERWLQEPERRIITIDVARDSSGNWNLYRREEGATRQPAVQDITGLKLLGFVTDSGKLVMADEPWPDSINALILRLSFAWGSGRNATVRFVSPQRLGRL